MSGRPLGLLACLFWDMALCISIWAGTDKDELEHLMPPSLPPVLGWHTRFMRCWRSNPGLVLTRHTPFSLICVPFSSSTPMWLKRHELQIPTWLRLPQFPWCSAHVDCILPRSSFHPCLPSKVSGGQHTPCTLLESAQIFEHSARTCATLVRPEILLLRDTRKVLTVWHVREMGGADRFAQSLAHSLTHYVIPASLKLRSSQILGLKECTAHLTSSLLINILETFKEIYWDNS